MFFPYLDDVALLRSTVRQPASETEDTDLETCRSQVAKDLVLFSFVASSVGGQLHTISLGSKTERTAIMIDLSRRFD